MAMTTLLNATSYYNGYPLLVHHSLVAHILREYSDRTNRDMYRMLSWNGVQIEGAEDENIGIQGDYPDSPLRVDWQQLNLDGELVVDPHPEKEFLDTARAFFNYTPKTRQWWRDTPDDTNSGVLDMWAEDGIKFDGVISHLETDARLPLFFGVVKALRAMQSVLKSPIYHFVECEDGFAPRLMEAAYDALPAESAKRLVSDDGMDSFLFSEAVNVDLVADFLVAKRAFRGWLAAKRVARVANKRGFDSIA
jgi:hypothetical protein